MNKEEAMLKLIECLEVLEWDLAIPEGPDDQEVEGLIIGTRKYIDSILDGEHIETDA